MDTDLIFILYTSSFVFKHIFSLLLLLFFRITDLKIFCPFKKRTFILSAKYRINVL